MQILSITLDNIQLGFFLWQRAKKKKVLNHQGNRIKSCILNIQDCFNIWITLSNHASSCQSLLDNDFFLKL